MDNAWWLLQLVGRGVAKFVTVLALVYVNSKVPDDDIMTHHIIFGACIYLFASLMMDVPTGFLQQFGISFAGDKLMLLPHFDEPYLSISLREFWSRRWNITAGA